MTARPTHGALPENVAGFVQLLRRAGLPLGPGHTIAAVEALAQVGITNKSEFYWALHATLVSRPEHRVLFRAAFDLYWRDPFGADAAMDALLSKSRMTGTRAPKRAPARLAPPSKGDATVEPPPMGAPEPVPMRMAFSNREILRTRDFEDMTSEELDRARDAIRRMVLDLRPIRTRRWVRHPRGRAIDLRRTLRSSLRSAGAGIVLERRTHGIRVPELVVLCDISGSMERYSRIVLHFCHTMANAGGPRVHTFLFGTRLTNVTRLLKDKDPDRALDRVGSSVVDWHGGTRIGAALGQFNRAWSRRVLGQGAIVLLVTDGLDREGGVGIAKEASRLRRSCTRLIWLNPLLRYEGFEPRAQGVMALLPEVDEHRPVHNLDSIEQLTGALSGRRTGGIRT